MSTRTKLSATTRRKRKAVLDLLHAVDGLVAAAKNADRAKRIILGEHVTEHDGKLRRGNDSRLADGEANHA